MFGLRPLVRLVVSAIGALVPLLFLSGSYSPLGGFAPDLFGSQSPLNLEIAKLLGTESISPLLPFGAAGITGFVIWSFLQRALREVEAATYRTPGMDPSKILKSMQIPSMPFLGGQGIAPETLPPDLTRSQYYLLRTCRQGYSKSKDLAKELSMDKREVEKEILVLQANGYLTKSNKLTSKSLAVLGN